jgi:hypothetical protein
VKQAIFEHFMQRFEAARVRRKQLDKEPEYIKQVFKRGVEQARAIAQPLVREVRTAVGII